MPMPAAPEPTGCQSSLATGAAYTVAETPAADPTRLHTRPPAASRLITGPPRGATWCQFAPPSCVAQTWGPNSHPSLALAKRTRETPLGLGVSTGAGTGTECHVAPPSRVRASAVHTAGPQGDVPSAHPTLSEIRVIEAGLNPAGRDPSGGPATAGPVGAAGPTSPWPPFTFTWEVRLMWRATTKSGTSRTTAAVATASQSRCPGAAGPGAGRVRRSSHAGWSGTTPSARSCRAWRRRSSTDLTPRPPLGAWPAPGE